MWMNPPSVQDVTTPKTHRTSKITKLCPEHVDPHSFVQFDAETINVKQVYWCVKQLGYSPARNDSRRVSSD
jgi:hypothetical protein